MQLYYCQIDNYGDRLNEWIWPRLIPDVLDADSDAVFVGIGTLINESLPKDRTKLIFGSGFGYSKTTPVRDDSWRIYCVRGPHTAAALGLSPEQAVIDPGVLAARLCPAVERKYEFSYMPHWKSLEYWDYEQIADRLGMHLISPFGDPEEITQEIARTKTLVTEALHGAIVADALRVPWVPVRTSTNVKSEKWRDWCASVELEYRPVQLPPLYTPAALQQLFRQSGRLKAAAKLLPNPLIRLGMGSLEKLSRKQLENILRDPKTVLSADHVLERKLARLDEKIEQLRADTRNSR